MKTKRLCPACSDAEMIALGATIGKSLSIFYECPACGHEERFEAQDEVAVAFLGGILAQVKNRIADNAE